MVLETDKGADTIMQDIMVHHHMLFQGMESCTLRESTTGKVKLGTSVFSSIISSISPMFRENELIIRTVHPLLHLKTHMESTPIPRDRVNIAEHPIIRIMNSQIQDKVRRLLMDMVKRQQLHIQTRTSSPLLMISASSQR
jgi:hypothetical protein